MINADNGEEEVLYLRNDKTRCRFKQWFKFKNFEIQLRLDYNNMLTVPPILDADIRDAETKEDLPKGVWHNTPPRYDPELKMTIYEFKGFDSLVLRFYTLTTSAINLSSSATICEPESTKK